MPLKSKILIILGVIISLLLIGASLLYAAYRSGSLQNFVLEKAAEKINIAADDGQMTLIRDLLGFNGTKNYLVLFLNNTEMRPGGGFIGVYGVIEMNLAQPKIIKMEGTEILDNLAPKNFPSIPPAPIKKYLKVDRWYFRDSNWSPDFALSSKKSLELYTKEQGINADKIDGVVGFTPTVLEDLLKIIGPVTVNGMEFNAENFTEKLEYEVEHGFAEKGIDFSDRKDFVGVLAKKIMTQAGKDLFLNWPKYKELFDRMIWEKQIMIYSPQETLQNLVRQHGWSGEMLFPENSDFVLWVDANLGALKTDAVLQRKMNYEIYQEKGEYYARVKMLYDHRGKFDWRTSRYISYTRVYAPVGSVLKKTDSSIDTGVENGRQWFGRFISIEPGEKQEVVFEYKLPEIIKQMIDNKYYSLAWQKQLGTNDIGLTLKLDFDKNLVSADPSENVGILYDDKYEFNGVLDKDQFFSAKFK